MHEFIAIIRVLIVGLVFGAGLPALFAVGMRLEASGDAVVSADGTVTQPGNPVFRLLGYALFAIIAVMIAIGILWIAKGTIKYYTGINLFSFVHTK